MLHVGHTFFLASWMLTAAASTEMELQPLLTRISSLRLPSFASSSNSQTLVSWWDWFPVHDHRHELWTGKIKPPAPLLQASRTSELFSEHVDVQTEGDLALEPSKPGEAPEPPAMAEGSAATSIGSINENGSGQMPSAATSGELAVLALQALPENIMPGSHLLPASGNQYISVYKEEPSSLVAYALSTR